MIDLNELQFSVQVGKTQSFTLAARELGMQKSSVSRAIANLETRLSVRLVERTMRRVALMEAGELFLDKGNEAVTKLSKRYSVDCHY